MLHTLYAWVRDWLMKLSSYGLDSSLVKLNCLGSLQRLSGKVEQHRCQASNPCDDSKGRRCSLSYSGFPNFVASPIRCCHSCHRSNGLISYRFNNLLHHRWPYGRQSCPFIIYPDPIQTQTTSTDSGRPYARIEDMFKLSSAYSPLL